MIRPPQLKAGDTVGLVAPSRLITEAEMAAAFKLFSQWGLRVKSGTFLFHRHGYFAGTDDERLSDLRAMFDDPQIKAVFCARGGYGLSRIVDRINLSGLRANPKWVIGFSDITALHLKLHRLPVESIHGVMPIQYGNPNLGTSLTSLRQLLFEGHINYTFPAHALNRTGQAKGQLIGGNLSLMVDSLGTDTGIDTAGKVLFLEEIDEYYYKVDRMINQLKRAGKLKDLNGLIIGRFTGLKDTKINFGFSLGEIVRHHLGASNIPVAFGLPIGHEDDNMALPCGRMVTLRVTGESVVLAG